MRKHRLETYKRIHRFDHAVDVEAGKIKREIGTCVKQGRMAEKLTDWLLQDPADEALAEELASLDGEGDFRPLWPEMGGFGPAPSAFASQLGSHRAKPDGSDSKKKRPPTIPGPRAPWFLVVAG